MRREREIAPAMTPEDLQQRNDAWRHSVQQSLTVEPHKRVKVHVRCNQPASDNTICPWDQWIETSAEFAQRNGLRAVYAHIDAAHPAQNARAVASRAWVQLADIGRS